MKSRVRDHFDQFLGRPLECVVDGEPVSVYSWPDPEDPETVIVATVGMSVYPQTVPAGMKCVVSEPRTELLMLLQPRDVKALASLLVDLAFYPRTHQTFLHWFHDLPLGTSVVTGSSLTALFFGFPPIDDVDFATFQSDGHRVDVLWAVPISDAERRLKVAQGADALEERLERVEVTDLFRKSTA